MKELIKWIFGIPLFILCAFFAGGYAAWACTLLLLVILVLVVSRIFKYILLYVNHYNLSKGQSALALKINTEMQDIKEELKDNIILAILLSLLPSVFFFDPFEIVLPKPEAKLMEYLLFLIVGLLALGADTGSTSDGSESGGGG